MDSSTVTASASRVAVAAAAAVLPFAAALLLRNIYVALLAAPLAAVMIRAVRSWRAWAWVVATVTVVATIGGWVAWAQMNAQCTVHNPIAPAAAFGISVLVGSLAGAGVAGTGGSALRVLAGAVLAAVSAAVMLAVSVFVAAGLGLPSLLLGLSHC